MNGKSYSIPVDMIFKKHYCSKCGTRLEREKTHRVVTKDDKDYYQFHDRGTFPRRDYDVYDYRWKCPYCNTRFSCEEQRILERIQKKQGYFVLSSSEVKSNYKENKELRRKSVLARSILIPIVFSIVAFPLFYFYRTDRDKKDLLGVIIIGLLCTAVMIVGAIRRHKGNYRSKYKYTYSYEQESQMERLHTYSSHNKDRIAVSNQCYCFYCKKSMDRSEITEYIDNGQTALCPHCNIDSILPDSIGEPINNEIVAQMHEYWF